jgi:hypothetical protein
MTQIKKNLLKVTLQLAAGMVCIAFVLTLGSCNKDFPNRLKTSSANDTAGVNVKQRRVLYIILDGVRGQAVRALAPTNITQVVKKAIYAYDGLSDFSTNAMTNAGSWSNMITGVTKDQHKVISENFAGNQIAAFPSLFTRFKQLNPKLRTVSIAASGIFNTNLAVDASNSQTFENDDASVKNAVVTELQNNNPNIVVAQFHSAELAGQANGYTNTTVQYNAAITTLDGYIGELLTALNARKTIAQEDWMVVIASNKGGAIPADPLNTDKSVYADATRNNFIIFYNPRFLTQIVAKPASDKIPYSGTAPNFTGINSSFSYAKLGNNTLGNVGTNGQFTFFCKIRYDGATSRYPSFLSKRASFTAGVPGWLLFLENDIFQLNISGGAGSTNTQVSGGTIRDGIWHSIAFKFWNNGSAHTVTMYLDGVKGLSLDFTSKGNIDSPSPLTLGANFISGEAGTIDVLIKEVAMFNVAIPDATIIANMRKTSIDATFPNFTDLAGYWPANEGGATTIQDVSGKAPNFTMSSNAKWKVFNDYTPNLDPLISNDFYTLVINNVDIPYQIYQWMGVTVQPTWQLAGKTWKATYTDVRNL